MSTPTNNALNGIYETQSGATYYVWDTGWVRENPEGRKEYVAGKPQLLASHLLIANEEGQIIAHSTTVKRFFEV